MMAAAKRILAKEEAAEVVEEMAVPLARHNQPQT